MAWNWRFSESQPTRCFRTPSLVSTNEGANGLLPAIEDAASGFLGCEKWASASRPAAAALEYNGCSPDSLPPEPPRIEQRGNSMLLLLTPLLAWLLRLRPRPAACRRSADARVVTGTMEIILKVDGKVPEDSERCTTRCGPRGEGEGWEPKAETGATHPAFLMKASHTVHQQREKYRQVPVVVRKWRNVPAPAICLLLLLVPALDARS